jgi:hypothetical protein
VAVLPLTLAIGLSRPGSLTTHGPGGMDRFGFSAWRADYAAAWTARHREGERVGLVPRPERPRDGGLAGAGPSGGTRAAAAR